MSTSPRTLSPYLYPKRDDTPPHVRQLQREIEVAKHWQEELAVEMREADEIQAVSAAIQQGWGRNGVRDVICEPRMQANYLRDLLNRFLAVKTAELKQIKGE